MDDRADFLNRLRGAGLGDSQIDAAMAFRQLVLDENERQNLTRLTSAIDFFEGHVLDVLELRKFREAVGASVHRCLDLGTGAGVPGLLSAALFSDERWVLVDSEVRKAEYLARSVEVLNLSDRVVVKHGRIEQLGETFGADWIVSRAVGAVEKIYSWLERCSTWNNLVLLKGPKWSEEWAAFEQSRWRHRLKVENRTEYSVGDGIQRVIIHLRRVPRGTLKVSDQKKKY